MAGVTPAREQRFDLAHIIHPLLGTGFGTFYIEFPAYASTELRAAFPEKERIINDAHNEYLQTLAETGLAGLAIFLSILFFFFWFSLRFYFKN